MDENELTQIENDLLSHEQYEKFHLLGTFQIVHPHGTREMWENFSSGELALSLKEILPQRPIKIFFIICRRHPELTPFFLDYFDHAKENRIESKDYIYFLMHRVEYIPVQWIVFHVTALSDLRYASHLVSATFSGSLRHNPKCIERLYMNNNFWREFIKNHPRLTFENTSSSWKKLLSLRSAIGEIISFRLPVKLMEFTRLDRKEYIRSLFNKTVTASELRKLLKITIIPFCEAHSIEIHPFVVSEVPKKDWSVQEKLSFITEYVKNNRDKKKALETMTVFSEQELNRLKDYAKKNSIDFIPLPKNIVKKKPQSTSGFIMRSSSIGEIPLQQTKLKPRSSYDSFKRSPSIDLSSIDGFDEEGSLSSIIANGEPSDPVEYANKLRRVRNKRDIKPIYDLADKFNIVVSYEDMYNNIIWGKRPLLERLLHQTEGEQFDEICSTLQLSNNEVIDYICGSIDYICYAHKIFENLSKYVNQSSIFVYFEYLQNYEMQMIHKDPISLMLRLYKNGLEVALKYANGKDLIHYSNLLHFTNKIIGDDGNSATQANNFEKLLYGDMKFLCQEYPSHSQNWEKETFINYFLSTDCSQLADSITFVISISDQAIKKDYLRSAFPLIDGYKYSILQFVLICLNSIDPIYQNDIEILNILHSSFHVKIDYHKLKEDPKKELEDAITLENVFEIIPLTDFFKLSRDDLLLDLMLFKMKSLKFDDYRPLLSRLQNSTSSSLQPKLLKLMKKFSMNDQIDFLNDMGLYDIRKSRQTMEDLKKLGLDNYFDSIYLNDPEKLLKVFYSQIELHEKLGNRLHIFAKKLATRFDLDLFEIQGHLIKIFLTEDEKQIEEENRLSKNPSIIQHHPVQQPQLHTCKYMELFDSIPEPQNLQRALFILRNWSHDNAIKWITDFVNDQKNTWISRSLAVQCWVTISDANLPENIKPSEFYFKSILEEVNFEIPKQLTVEFLTTELHKLNQKYKEKVGENSSDDEDEDNEQEQDDDTKDIKNKLKSIAQILLLYIVCNKVDNVELIIESLKTLLLLDPRFIMLNVLKVFYAIPSSLKNNEVFEIFISALSIPIEMIITKKIHWQPAKSQHAAVMRNIFNLLSLTPKPVNYLIINKKKAYWGDLAEMLCKVGCNLFAAELGSHLVSIKDRNEVLRHLMNGYHFDDALTNGFDRKKIFDFIVNGHIEQATETLIDSHFVAFTNWLKEQNDNESINKVEATLRAQGRTIEAKRMRERLAKL